MSDQDNIGSTASDDRRPRSMGRGVRISLWLALTAAVLVGVVFFLMFGPPRLAARFAEPEFCASCHEMKSWLVGFEEADHSDLESCNDCHLPHGSTVEYYFWEGIVGIRDLAKHTVGAIPPVIQSRQRTREWILENCHRCHDEEIAEDHGETRDYCWDCHDDVFHEVDQQKSGLSNALLVLSTQPCHQGSRQRRDGRSSCHRKPSPVSQAWG